MIAITCYDFHFNGAEPKGLAGQLAITCRALIESYEKAQSVQKSGRGTILDRQGQPKK